MINRKKCRFSHNFSKMGYMTFSGDSNLTTFEVFVCQNCGLTRFYMVESRPKGKKSAKKDAENSDFDPSFG